MKGPLAPWAPGFAERLTTLGYTPRVVERHLHLAGGLSTFLARRGLGAVGPRVLALADLVRQRLARQLDRDFAVLE